MSQGTQRALGPILSVSTVSLLFSLARGTRQLELRPAEECFLPHCCACQQAQLFVTTSEAVTAAEKGHLPVWEGCS